LTLINETREDVLKKIILVLFTGLVLIACNDSKEVVIKPDDDVSFNAEVNKFKKSYEYFIKHLNEGEIQKTWYLVTKDTEYKIDGDYKDKKLDCYGAYYEFFRALGANFVNENIESIKKRVHRLHEMNQITIYKDGRKSIIGYDDIKKGSIIIFYNHRMQTPWHIGIIYGKGNNILQFCEMTGYTGRPNYANIPYDHDSINLIFYPSWYFWVGNLFQKAFAQ
jgi:hypothetical protein